MTWTVIGARGFIGSAFTRALRARGDEVVELTSSAALEWDADLGDVVYASGVAWDANRRAADAQTLHVDVPRALLEKRITSLMYISSTRVYGDAIRTNEPASLHVDESDVYASSKIAGEKAMLADPRPSVKVVRLSNVYGESFRSGLMLSDFLRQAAQTGSIVVRSSRASEKDHVSIEDVVELTLRIVRHGKERLYNVAAGKNTLQGAVLDAIAASSGCRITVEGDAIVRFAPIDISRVRDEFDFQARDVIADIPALWEAFRAHFASISGAGVH